MPVVARLVVLDRWRLAAALEEAAPEERATLETQQAVGCAFASDAPGMRKWTTRALAGAPDDPALVVTATALNGLGAQWEADRPASDAISLAPFL